MQVGTSPVQHALKMNTYIERLGRLGFVMDHELSIDLILSNLIDNFSYFVLNYHMQSKETSIPKLINLLKTVEPTLKNKAKTMVLVDSSISKKGFKNKKKKKKAMKAKGGVTKKKVKEATLKDTYFHCGQDGHWRRNYKAYLGSLKKKASDALYNSQSMTTKDQNKIM